MKEYLNKQVKELNFSGIRKFFDIVSEMEGAISLGVGEPDFDTPWSAKDAAIDTIRKGNTQYTSNMGLKELLESSSRYLQRFDLHYDINEMMITVGASEAIDLVCRSIIEAGDEILIPEPSYVSYAPCVTLAGGKPIAAPCHEENKFKLTPESIEQRIGKRTKAIILPYPNNPTGAIMEREELEALIPIIEKYDLLVISDEIYAELTYDKKHVSIASLKGMRERCVVINGFSKAYAMTGWRVGMVAAPFEIRQCMLKIHQYTALCAPTISQYAANAALQQSFRDDFRDVEIMREEYNRRRRFMVDGFNKMGLHCFEAEGAFYVFPCVDATGMDGETFAEKLLESKKIAVVPGGAFGKSCDCFIRVSYAYSMKKLEKAMKEIAAFVAEIKEKERG